MDDCLFCKIIKGDIPGEKVFENDSVYAFKDINPAAPVHVLIVPKRHIAGADELTAEHAQLLSELFSAVKQIAADLNLANGWRVVTNVLGDGGQTVRHLHFHLLGGAKLGDFGQL